MNKELFEKHAKLVDIINSMNRVCIAYSGGVDSALLLKVCGETLIKKQVLAVTAVSGT